MSTLQRAVRAALRSRAEPERAAGMQAYMKSEMPYLGVRSANVKAACREVFADYAFDHAADWQADVRNLWHGAQHREERYAAMLLMAHRKAKPFQTLAALPLYEELIVDGAWWDFVDEIAANRVGPLLAAVPAPMTTTMRAWSTSSDMWKRRTSIICQLKFRTKTDRDLLAACIEPSIESKEFFLRKAIGWSLRELAKVDPAWVKRYVKANEARLSGLSRREALKHLASP
jgi:3-methyladenine DNA glycosylase AlkD